MGGISKKLKFYYINIVYVQLAHINRYKTARATATMAQYNPKVIRRGGVKDQYYSYDDELYTKTFPTEWATCHLPGTGPKECLNCASSGSWNGVFIGYCTNCAIIEYNYMRGSGFIEIGEEYKIDHKNSATNTYLHGIEWDDIGDIYFMDSMQIWMEHELERIDDRIKLLDEEKALLVEKKVEIRRDIEEYCS